MARAINERLIGVDAFRALDLDYLTEHITSFCLAALGSRPPLNAEGETMSLNAELTGITPSPTTRGGDNGVDRSQDAGR